MDYEGIKHVVYIESSYKMECQFIGIHEAVTQLLNVGIMFTNSTNFSKVLVVVPVEDHSFTQSTDLNALRGCIEMHSIWFVQANHQRLKSYNVLKIVISPRSVFSSMRSPQNL